MVRTEWLNTGVEDLASSFKGRCNCQLARFVKDFQDTAAVATERGHRTRAVLLHRLVRRAQHGCSGKHLLKAGPRGGRS